MDERDTTPPPAPLANVGHAPMREVLPRPMEHTSNTLIITGSSGLIGSSFIGRVGGHYPVMGFDGEGPPRPPPETAHVIDCDLSSDDSVGAALDEVRGLGYMRIASIIHDESLRYVRERRERTGAQSDSHELTWDVRT